MKSRLFTLMSFLLVLICIACSSGGREVSVIVYNAELEDKVLKIDGDTIKLSDGYFTTLRLTQGTHQIESDGLFPDSIVVRKSGLLASGLTRFAKMPIIFGEESTIFAKSNPYPRGPILIQDSLIIYDKNQFSSQAALVARLKKTIAKKPESRVFDYSLSELKPNNNGFIEKDWNYDLGSIPESISVDSETASTERSVIIDFQMLQLYTMLEEAFAMEAVENDEDLVTIMQYIGMRDQ